MEEKLLKPQELIVTGRGYQVLIPSIYDDQSEELLYIDRNKLYSFNKVDSTETLLVDMGEKVDSYQFDVEDKWLAWVELGMESIDLNIMDRETNEVETVEGVNVTDLTIEGDYLVYSRFGEMDDKPVYSSINLNTMETTNLHEMTGGGIYSNVSAWEGGIVIPEGATEGGKSVTNLYVYDLKTSALIEKFTLPYQMASGIIYNDDRIYAHFQNEGIADSLLAYVDIETGEFTEISTPKFVEFAVYGDYLALSVEDGPESSYLQLYKMAGTELEELPAFSKIADRLVRPRFTDEGTLVVNGAEGDFAMYLLNLGVSE